MAGVVFANATVPGFDPASDYIVFGAQFQAGRMRLSQDGADLVVALDGVFDTLRLSGLSLDTLTDANFLFADGGVVRLGTAAPDSLAGTAFGDFVSVARGGSDSVAGGDGNDRILAGASLDAGDRIDGGTGVDELHLAGTYAAPVLFVAETVTGIERFEIGRGGTVRLTLAAQTLDGATAAVVFDASSQLNADGFVLDGSAEQTVGFTALGGAAADRLTGGGGSDSLSGGGGDDLLDGGAGDDQLSGGDDADLLIGGAGNDTLRGGFGADRFDGGAGNDHIVLFADGANDTVDGGADGDTADYGLMQTAITLALASTGTVTLVEIDIQGRAGTDTLIGIENVIGGSGNDRLTGDIADNVLSGRGGNDRLDGGLGNDTADYGYLPGGLTVTLNALASVTVAATPGDTDTLVSIENIRGGAGNDLLAGDGSANTLAGNGGDDQLRGGGGADLLDGGAGDDTADYGYLAAPVTATLNAGGSATVVATGGDIDILLSVENIAGGAGADTLVGDALANVLSGGGGNDLLDGGAGSDTADYGYLSTALTATLDGAPGRTTTLAASTGDTDRLVSIENIVGGAGNDILAGDAADNLLSGGAGDDRLRGDAGNDILSGGNGNDTADYGYLATGLTATLDSVFSIVIGGGETDSLSSVENIGGGSGADDLTGDAVANTLDGGAGDDRLAGGDGADLLLGGGGSDRFVLEADGASDTVDGGADGDLADWSATQASVTAMQSGLGPVVVTMGDGAADTLVAIETFFGGAGDDLLAPGTGDQVLRGNGGDDVLDGGAGNDTADYSYLATALEATLGGALAATVVVAQGETDTLIAIDNILGGAAGDALGGDARDNRLAGNAGDDILSGAAGNDLLDGGAGADTADYSYLATALTATMGSSRTFVLIAGAGDTDTLESIENIAGGAGDDVLAGNDAANTLSGKGGDDRLRGGGGDVLDGGAGNDTADYSWLGAALTVTLDAQGTAAALATGMGTDTLLSIENAIGGDGDDRIVGDGGANILSGRGGNDLLDGGGDGDTADYGYLATGLTATLNSGAAVTVVAGAGDTDTLLSIENLVGGSGNDVLAGDDAANTLSGGGGDDSLSGGDGPDILRGGSGNDRFVLMADGSVDVVDGGTGDDTVDFSASTIGITVVLDASGAGTVSDMSGGVDVLAAIEILIGGAGGDWLAGGDADNVLRGNAGDDTLDGGAGSDTADYAYLATALTLSLAAAGVTTVAVAPGETDMLAAIENLLAGAGDDLLTGNAAHNRLAGGAGDDRLAGGQGNDRLDGGSGNDTADYGYLASAFTATLNAAGTATVIAGPGDTDTLVAIENIIGGAGGDTLIGDVAANTLSGGRGNDLLDGGGGDDTADYAYLATALTAILTGAATVTVSATADDTDRLVRIQNLAGGRGSDWLFGDDAANRLSGGAGDDRLRGGAGNDVLMGGADQDTADYSYLSTGLTATLDSLATVTLAAGAGDTDALISIENLVAGSGNDRLTGDGAANLLDGGDGDDVISADSGADTLRGAAGRDTFLLGADGAADRVEGGDDLDTVDYALAATAIVVTLASRGLADLVLGGGETDTLISIENIIGGLGDDILVGDDLANVLSGGMAGSDTLDGGGGDDVLSGGAGDTLSGGDGDDRIDLVASLEARAMGGAGTDTLRLLGWAAGATVSLADISAISDGGIEVVDIAGASAGMRLILSAAAVAGISSQTGTLRIAAAAGQTVEFVDGGWIRGADAGGTQDWTNGGASVLIGGAPAVIDRNDAPVIGSDGGAATAAIAVDETTALVTTVTASDSDFGQTLSYAIVGGADAARFTIGPSTGILSFLAAPDFESPQDSDADNRYEVVVRVSDNGAPTSLSDTQALTVTVIDVFEGPPPDTRAPLPVSGGASIDATGTLFTLAFDEDLDQAPIGVDSFSATSEGQPVDIVGVSVTGRNVVVSLASPVAHGSSTTISYADLPDDQQAGVLQDSAGNDVAGFSQTVLRPVFVSGSAYHWKSHALMSGVSVSAVGDGKAPGPASPVEIRNLSFDANGDASCEIWALPGSGAGISSFAFDLRVAAGATVAWTPSAAIDGWSVGTASEPGRLAVEAAGAAPVLGSFALGTAVIDLPPGTNAAVMQILSASLGGVAAPAFPTQIARQTTGGNGGYALTDLVDDLYGLSLQRGVSDAGSAINSQDALAALKIAVGRNPNADPDGAGPLQAPMLSPYQLIAADVNGDGRVTSADALAILKMSVRRADAPARDWIFVREDEDFWNEANGSLAISRNAIAYGRPAFAEDLADGQSRNFVAVLKGDVNGSWAPGGDAQFLDPDYFASLAQTLGVPVEFWG